MNIKKRAIVSVGWNLGSNWTAIAIQFVRLIFLSRWLSVEVFGIYAFASSVVLISARFVDFGMSGAFVHRTPETEDENQAATVLFTLRMGLTMIWTPLMLTATLLLTHGDLQTALMVLVCVTAGMQATSIPGLILLRRVTQQRTASIGLLSVLIATPIMLWLARNDLGIWSLLSLNIVILIVSFVGLYLWRPIWRPRVTWDRQRLDYFLSYGSKNFISAVLYDALDRVDDLWVGFFLGPTSLGFYSRAYSLATYPRKVLALPVNWVIGGAYAELQHDPDRLSSAFSWSNSILIRGGFYLAGLLVLIAPEFILILLGEKWMPMLITFRLMLIFSLLDPLKVNIASLIALAGGKPQHVAQARLFQLTILLIGMFTLGVIWGIEGVALAVDIMLVTGIAILLLRARAYVQLSLRKLFAAPMIALVTALGAGFLALLIVDTNSTLLTASVKAVVFTATYITLLFLFDRSFMIEAFGQTKRAVSLR